MEYGTPLPPDQKVEYAVYFDHDALGKAMIAAAVQKSNAPFGMWAGHVSHSVSPETAAITATVYIWRESESKPKEDIK